MQACFLIDSANDAFMNTHIDTQTHTYVHTYTLKET